MTLLLSLISGFGKDLGQGGLVSVIAILLVFAILAVIIAITFGAGKLIDSYAKKDDATKQTKPQTTNSATTQSKIDVDMNDEDAIVATLVASIDYRQQTKKDIKVISIKEIK